MSTALMTRPAPANEQDLIEKGINTQGINAQGSADENLELAKLSPMELRVARLVADGLTNRQIGERLFVSHRTVDTHVSHLFSKLNVTSRVRIALVVGA